MLSETSYFVESKLGKVANVLLPPEYSIIRERKIRRRVRPIWIYGVQPLRSYPNVVMYICNRQGLGTSVRVRFDGVHSIRHAYVPIEICRPGLSVRPAQ